MVDPSKFKDIFVSEAEDYLQKLDDNLLKLEKKPENKKLLDELMRSSHTIKGSSATMGYKQFAFLAHVMEDVFDYARNDMLKITPKIISELLQSIDALDKSLATIKKTGEELLTIRAIASRLKRLTGVAIMGVEKSFRTPREKPITKIKEKRLVASPEGKQVVTPQSESLGGKKKKPRPGESIQDIEIQGIMGADKAVSPEIQGIAHIKVPVERLDNLMNLAEEFLVNKMRLAQDIETKNLGDLPAAIDAMGRLVSDLQYNVTQARMVPIGQIFDRFSRMVRDLAKKEKKIVELEMEGKEIELDRTILDKIGEPLVHLLRNAVDHGIVKEGKVSLMARREKGYIIIEVANTGTPFDLGVIKQTAIKKGIIPAQKAQDLSRDQIIDLIYHPRLSTSAKITETSGRGVGLNIVKTRIESLGGTVSLESPIEETGQGVKFTLKLPLTLAIIQALLFKVSRQIYAIPLSQIVRLVRVPVKEIKKVLDTETAVVNERDIPLVRLDKLFSSPFSDVLGAMRGYDKIEKTKEEGEKKESRQTEVVIIVKKEDRPVAGLVADELMTGQEIVIKPLTGILRQNKGFAGITILGDGRPALILDVATLI